jgi:hypothetical protein
MSKRIKIFENFDKILIRKKEFQKNLQLGMNKKIINSLLFYTKLYIWYDFLTTRHFDCRF